MEDWLKCQTIPLVKYRQTPKLVNVKHHNQNLDIIAVWDLFCLFKLPKLYLKKELDT